MFFESLDLDEGIFYVSSESRSLEFYDHKINLNIASILRRDSVADGLYCRPASDAIEEQVPF